jgi:transposase
MASSPVTRTADEWAFIAPYLALVREDAPQRVHNLREVFNALRWIVRAGASWRMLPHDFPPWEAVYQQTQRWINAGIFEAMVSWSMPTSLSWRRTTPYFGTSWSSQHPWH